MHLAQHKRKSTNGEQLIGLVNGVSAIILTLLAKELPVLITKEVESGEGMGHAYYWVTMNMIVYFFCIINDL